MRHDSAECVKLPGNISLEAVVCVLILGFFAVQGAIPGIAPNQASEMTNVPATGLMKIAGISSQVCINTLICVLALANLQRLWNFVSALQWTAAIAAFAVCSILWSQDAVMTARRSVPFVLATIFGLYLASRFSVDQQLSILRTVLVLAALASAGLAIFCPSIGLDASTGHHQNWQGVFTQKNACGRAMVFATAAIFSQKRITLFPFICLLLFLLVLAMSGSRGAWLIEVLLFLCCAMLHVLACFSASNRRVLLLIICFAASAFSVVAWMYFPLLALLLGRDATLTGRTAIWQQVWLAIMKHPFAGYGFAAFWQGMKGESYNVILALRFVIFHAHNGFLEIWLELGAIGLLLFGLSYLRACCLTWMLLQAGLVDRTKWMLFVLILIAIYNIDENSLLVFNGLYWVLYVAAVVDIEILCRERKMLMRQHQISLHPAAS